MSNHTVAGRWLVVAAAFFAPLHASAQTAVPDSADLAFLIRLVRERNPAAEAARLGADAMRATVAQSRALPDPHVSAMYQPLPIHTALGTQRTQWRLDQEVPFPGKRELRSVISSLGADAAEAQSESMTQDLILDVKRNFFELRRLDRELELIDEFSDRLDSYERSASKLYEVGKGAQQTILKAQLERNALDQRTIQVERLRSSAIQSLARLVNSPLDADFRPIFPGADYTDAALSADSLGADSLVADALRIRPELHALASAQFQAERQTELAHLDFRPDFGLSVTYFDIAKSDAPPTSTGRDALALGVNIKLPVQRTRLKARVEETMIRESQVEAAIEAASTAIRSEVLDALAQATLNRREIALLRETLIPQAETTLQATLSAYSTGRVGFLDLLDSERTLFNLQTSLEEASARWLVSLARLERAVGVDSLSDIETTTP